MNTRVTSIGNDPATDPAKDWIPLLEYALKKGVSLSTLRRHIKAGKIPFKIQDGRYLLFDEAREEQSNPSLTRLQLDLQRAQEEIAELKTLIALYEEKIPNQRPGI